MDIKLQTEESFYTVVATVHERWPCWPLMGEVTRSDWHDWQSYHIPKMPDFSLTPSLRRPCIHAIFFPTACRTACKHAFCFLRVRPEAVSTRHSWLWQTLDDVYTRRCFSESEGTRFGAPGQKALPSGNEWTEWNEWMYFCLIPLSTTGSVEVPGTNW